MRIFVSNFYKYMAKTGLGLILEGGGMRGVFTAGTLDCFIDHNLRFPLTIAVSAGASNGLSYASRQRGRAKFCDIDLLEKHRYIGAKYLLKERNIMDFDLLFNKIPTEIAPYDYNTYSNSKERFVIVASNCQTGEAEYFEEKQNRERLLSICRASCSLPFVCPIAYVDKVPMLDGGICDAIPIRKAISEGYERNVIVLTRNRGYRKRDSKALLPLFCYRKHPALRQKLKDRNLRYNETMSFIEQLEAEGKVVVIRPEKKIEVGRMETNIDKLTDLYNQGYERAEKALSAYASFFSSIQQTI